MAKYQKKTDYQAKYPGVSEKIIEVLEKSDRQMEYLQYDIKVERCRIDSASGAVTYLPSREDSYERLLEGNRQFAAGEDVDDAAIKTVMIEKMMTCLKQLKTEEQELIMALFFNDDSEHQLSRKTGVPQRTIHDRKVKILAKLKKLMEK